MTAVKTVNKINKLANIYLYNKYRKDNYFKSN